MNDRIAMHLHYDDFAELQAAIAASDAEGSHVDYVGELVAALEPEQREAMLDRFRPRLPAAPAAERKRQAILLVEQLFRFYDAAERAGGRKPLTASGGAERIHAALAQYEASRRWKEHLSAETLPAAQPTADLHRILLLCTPRGRTRLRTPSAKSIVRMLGDPRKVGLLSRDLSDA